MVHAFFELMAMQPELVDRFTKVKIRNVARSFRDFYRNLFPDNGIFETNVESYLDVIENNFSFRDDLIKISRRTKLQAETLFRVLGVPHNLPENFRIFRFWLFLSKIYLLELATGTISRDDNVFGFMSAFNLHETKVVIIASDPSRSCNSSGFAFHGSKCPSTRQFIDFLNFEMRLAGKMVKDEESELELSNSQLDRWKEECNFMQIIKQKVLLLNSYLTYNQPKWTAFTDCLVSYLSGEKQNLVFILVGGVADMKTPLIDHYKHCIVNVNHPGYTQRQNRVRPAERPRESALHWHRVLPLLNANFYLFQVALKANPRNLHAGTCGMVDWSRSSELDAANWNARLDEYRELFGTALSNMLSARNDSKQFAYICDVETEEPAILIKQCPNGKLILRRSIYYELTP